MAQGSPADGPRGAQDGPRGPQEEPQMGNTSRHFESSARTRPPGPPAGAQEVHKRPQEAPKRPKRGPERLPIGPRRTQNCLQEAPPGSRCDDSPPKRSIQDPKGLAVRRKPMNRSSAGPSPIREARGFNIPIIGLRSLKQDPTAKLPAECDLRDARSQLILLRPASAPSRHTCNIAWADEQVIPQGRNGRWATQRA